MLNNKFLDAVSGPVVGDALETGQWTDDTSFALCLAVSLIEMKAFDHNKILEDAIKLL